MGQRPRGILIIIIWIINRIDELVVFRVSRWDVLVTHHRDWITVYCCVLANLLELVVLKGWQMQLWRVSSVVFILNYECDWPVWHLGRSRRHTYLHLLITIIFCPICGNLEAYYLSISSSLLVLRLNVSIIRWIRSRCSRACTLRVRHILYTCSVTRVACPKLLPQTHFLFAT